MKLYLYQEGDYSSSNCLTALLFQQISASLVESTMWSKFSTVCCFSSAVGAEIGHDSVRQGLNTLLFAFEFIAESRGVEVKAVRRKVKVRRQLLLWWDTGFYTSAVSAVTSCGEGWKKSLWTWKEVTKSCKYLSLLFLHGISKQQFGNNLVPKHRCLEIEFRPFTRSW